jgi:phosphoribosylglycinamide formyltransferase-1
MVERLRRYGVELVVLAGYDRVLSPEFVEAFPHRIINMHPSLLPAFGGAGWMAPRPQAEALAHGCKITGCTIHLVTTESGVDAGPIVAQAAVPIYDDDTVDTLVARVLRQEHRLLLETVRLFAEGRIRVEGRRVFTGSLRPPDEPGMPG